MATQQGHWYRKKKVDNDESGWKKEQEKRLPKSKVEKKSWTVGDEEHRYQTPEGFKIFFVTEKELKGKGPSDPDDPFFEIYQRQAREREERYRAWGESFRRYQGQKSGVKEVDEEEELKREKEHNKWREEEKEKCESVFKIGGNKSWASWE